jgi:hypothetical protein
VHARRDPDRLVTDDQAYFGVVLERRALNGLSLRETGEHPSVSPLRIVEHSINRDGRERCIGVKRFAASVPAAFALGVAFSKPSSSD